LQAQELDRRRPATYTLPESLLKRLKTYSLRAQLEGEEGINQSEIVARALAEYLAKRG
jgi:hypothetical protein